ncbi:MAG: Gfo/Idh/MocA family oxidoreductase [Candidatus Omnitrophica bacterium]|nr:Gfo/Idh/MocA family oxidoreductase [Candidatus Omnitrophota bacterium]
MDKLNVGVIGVGFLGSLHARIYRHLEEVTLVGVCDCYKKRAKKVAKKFHTDYYLNYKDLIGKTQAVSIAVPTHLHYQIAKDFLNAGVNVLIEKPITKTLQEADELIVIARKKGLILQVGHIERFNSAIQAVEGFLKEPRFIECHRMGPFKKRVSDVGVVLDLMIHDIDIVLGLVKSEVKSIEAVGVKILSDHEDIANVRFTFENGTISDLIASRVTKKVRRTISIFQKDSFISLNYADQSATIHKKKDSKVIKKKLKIKKGEPLKKELVSFVDCVLHKARPLVSGEEGRRALAVAVEIGKKIRETTEK